MQKIVISAIRTIRQRRHCLQGRSIVEVKPEPKGEFTVAWTRLDPLVQLYSLDNNSSVGGIGVDFQVYEGLYRLQLTEPGVIPSQEIYVPEVAESWRVAQDLSKITFAIRKGIQWHNGWGELTAEEWSGLTTTLLKKGRCTTARVVHQVTRRAGPSRTIGRLFRST